MKWEELKTPQAVMAAFEAGRRVEYAASQYCVWVAATVIAALTAALTTSPEADNA